MELAWSGIEMMPESGPNMPQQYHDIPEWKYLRTEAA
jgi:hypothetical protein